MSNVTWSISSPFLSSPCLEARDWMCLNTALGWLKWYLPISPSSEESSEAASSSADVGFSVFRFCFRPDWGPDFLAPPDLGVCCNFVAVPDSLSLLLLGISSITVLSVQIWEESVVDVFLEVFLSTYRKRSCFPYHLRSILQLVDSNIVFASSFGTRYILTIGVITYTM